ncbi:hypothetical protein ACFOY2_19265 [Nonomuraea purpurea]|uniref:WD40 repeat domain-containing protein n=1 Tax=Nonomuraea purpurea TaxID=1849276 RepID=A0ABV8G5W6_9ACTN
MRHSSATVALLASAVIGGLGLTPVAAHAQSAPPVARAAWIKSCKETPCGRWQLVLRDGRTVPVRDAAATKPRSEEPGAFAISANGRVLAYERTGDHRVVVQRVGGGRLRELPKISGDYGLTLSPEGGKLLIDYFDEPERRPSKVITVATGRTTTLPAAETPYGFSADGDEVLTTRRQADNTTAMYARGLEGGTLRQTPPQVVAGALTFALAADGKTVAVFTSGDAETRRPPRVRTYDLETGALSEAADLPFKTEAPPDVAVWDADGRLTVTERVGEDGEPTVVRVLTVDPASGAATQSDRYRLTKSRYGAVMAGE